MATRDLRDQLSEDAIVDAAIELAGEVGVQNLTMRSLGERLGVTAMALYYHVPKKDVLLQLMANRLIEGIQPPGLEGGPWDAELAALARALRSALRRYPGVGTSLLGSDVPTPAMDRITAASVDMLVSQHFDAKEAYLAFTAVHNFLLGRLRMEDAFGRDSSSPRRRLGQGGVPPLPHVPADEHFEYGLAALLAGIQAGHEGSPP